MDLEQSASPHHSNNGAATDPRPEQDPIDTFAEEDNTAPLAPFLKPPKRLDNVKNKVWSVQVDALASTQLMWAFRME